MILVQPMWRKLLRTITKHNPHLSVMTPIIWKRGRFGTFRKHSINLPWWNLFGYIKKKLGWVWWRFLTSLTASLPLPYKEKSPWYVCAFDLANCGNISLVPYPLITISELTVANHRSITSLHVPYGFASSYIKSIHLRNEINLIVLLLLSVFIFLITLFFIYISLFHFVYGERLWKGEKGDELYYFFLGIYELRGDEVWK